MNKVVVVLQDLPKSYRLKAQHNEEGGTSANNTQSYYEGWIPSNYLVSQLKQDVTRYWRLKSPKYDLYDSSGNVLHGDSRLESLQQRAPLKLMKTKTGANQQLADSRVNALLLRKDSTYPLQDLQCSVSAAEGGDVAVVPTDPFWVQEQLFDMFLLYALQNVNNEGKLWISSYQFKLLLQKVTAMSSFQTTKRKLDFDNRVMLAFKTATTNCSGAGATFEKFLDALVDVACFMFPKAAAKDQAFEKLVTEFILPYHKIEESRSFTSLSLSWTQMAEILSRKKVHTLIQRFARPLGALAGTYSSTIGGTTYDRNLQFYEFSKFVHGIIPKSILITSSELCKAFIHCCRIELAQFYSDHTTLASLQFSKERDTGYCESSQFIRGGTSAVNGGIRGLHKNADPDGALNISCERMMSVCSYLALLAMPRLIKVDALPAKQHCDGWHLQTKVAVSLLKAFLHHIANHLTTRGNHIRKNASFNAARAKFLQEFKRMHREDNLADYLTDCAALMMKRLASTTSDYQVANNPKNSLQESTKHSTFINEGDPNSNSEKQREDTGQADVTENEWNASDAHKRTEQERIQEEFTALLYASNEADEMYTFLAGELHRHVLEQRLENLDAVPQMLDIWVAAGHKYSEVISHAESHPKWHATLLSRFGKSLFVFATQILRRTTKVYAYEEMFYLTNAKVYSVNSDVWNEGKALFTTDLALQTLSVASNKLTHACDIFVRLVSSCKYDDLHDHDEEICTDGENESDQEDEDLDNEDNDTVSAQYDKYIDCLYYRAACLAAYGDILAHKKKCIVDYDLAHLIEQDDANHTARRRGIDTVSSNNEIATVTFYSSNAVLSKTSSPGQFYREAYKMLHFVIRHSKGGPNFPMHRLHDMLAMVEFKLATHLTRGSVVEKRLLDDALMHLNLSQQAQPSTSDSILVQKKEYISAISILRHKFFQPHITSALNGETSGCTDVDVIAPLYRFVLAAAFQELDTKKLGFLSQSQLCQLNKTCGRGNVTDSVMKWLLANFDHQQGGLTEKGLMAYFCWLAEAGTLVDVADPLGFCEILDILTSKHTETQHTSIASSVASHHRQQHKASPGLKELPRRASVPSGSERGRIAYEQEGIAECFVVLSGTMTTEACGDLHATRSLAEVRLEPQVVDMLPSTATIPEELSKFCFPDPIYLSSEARPAKMFDIVLTDVKGSRLYGSCLHFVEEKSAMDVLSLISGIQRGKTATLPSWLTLKDIQNGQTNWKCFIPKCLCILSSHPLFQTLRECVFQLYRLSLSKSPSISVESFIFNILEQIPLPSTGSIQTYFRLLDRPRLLMGTSTNVPLFYPTEVDFTILFQCLSPENILKVYSLLLTERKVVLCANNHSILTPVAETLRALLHPFECQHVYIPVLPLSLLDFISAPVPFFMGVRSDQQVQKLTHEGVTVVDLDKNELLLPSNEALPSLPDVKAKKLLQALRKVSVWSSMQRTKENFGSIRHEELTEIPAQIISRASYDDLLRLTQHYDELVEKWSEIQTLFSSFVFRLLKNIRKYCVKTTILGSSTETTTFDKRSFLNMYPSIREFSSHLFQTQHFQRFIERSDSFSNMLAATEIEQSWLAVRSMSVLRKSEPVDESSSKSQKRKTIQAPLPLTTSTNIATDQIVEEQQTTTGFPIFNPQAYHDLMVANGQRGRTDTFAEFSHSSLFIVSENSSASTITLK